MSGSTEPYTDGSIITASGQNSAHWRVYTEQGLNHIRQLINRAGVYSAGNIGGWGEAYVDTDGQNNSVDTQIQPHYLMLINMVLLSVVIFMIHLQGQIVLLLGMDGLNMRVQGALVLFQAIDYNYMTQILQVMKQHMLVNHTQILILDLIIN